jgi:hypothetical protein
MSREIEIHGKSKSLAACTLEDVETLSAGAVPGTVLTGYGAAPQGQYARLAQEMRDFGVSTVTELGDAAVRRWEAELGLLDPADAEG